jgi:uncharacterized protein YkwD
MSAKMKAVIFFFLITVIGLLVACSQAPEPTPIPTDVLEPTPEPEAEPTEEPPPPEPEIVVVSSEIVVESLVIQILDEAAGDVQVVVEGYTTNTCNEVGQVTASREGDAFSIKVESSLVQDVECEGGIFPFEETIALDVEGLSPGNYYVSSGIVESFEFGAETPDEAVEEPEEQPTEEAAEAETEDEPAEAEPQGECEDFALFLADVTIPDNTEVQAGEVFTKTWEVQNNGTCTWGSGYELVFVSGPFTEALPLDDPFPEVGPSESTALSVAVTAPGTAGVHSGVWVIQRPDGEKIRVQEDVNFDLWAIVEVPGGSASASTDVTRVVNDAGVVCAQTNPAYDEEILRRINQARADNGLPAYELQPQLTNAAWLLTNDMACNDFVDHTGSDGSDWFARIAAQGYVYENAAENIYFSYGGVPEIAMNWWMDSSLHRGNILSSEFTQIGIAYGLNPQTGGSYYTLVFAVPEAEE